MKLLHELISWYCHNYPELAEIMEEVDISMVEKTELGFFAYFNNSGQLRISDDRINIPGPFVSSPQVPCGAVSLLNISKGAVNFIEVMSMEDAYDANTIVDFELINEL